MSPEASAESRPPRPQDSNSNRVNCDYCGRHFSRPSHLNRHRLSHLPADRRLTIPCDKCRKTFGRYDVLLRHLRSTHNIDLGRRHPAQRSCDRCVQKRRRCDRRLPCELCQATGDVCHYPDHVTGTYPDKTAPRGAVAQAEAEAVAAAATKRRSSHEDGQPDGQPSGQPNGQPDSHDSSTSRNNSRGSSTTMDPSAQSGSDMKESPATTATEMSQEPLFGTGFPPTTLGPILATPLVDALPANCNAPGLAAMPYANTFVPPFPETDGRMMSSDQFIPPALPTGENTEYHDPARFDWLSYPFQNYNQSANYGVIPNNVTVPMAAPVSIEPMPSVEPPPSIDTPPPSMPSSCTSRKDSIGPLTLPKISSQGMTNSPVPPWQIDENESLHPRRFILPPLREVMQNTLRLQIPNYDATAKDVQAGIVSLMAETYISKPETITDPDIAGARQFLSSLMDEYFKHSYHILPVVHRPTFELSGTPTVQVAVMATLGSLMRNSEHGADDAKVMSEISMSILTYLGASNSAIFGEITYITALAMNLIYSVWSGSRQLYQYVDRSRGILMGSLRGLKNLSVRLSTNTDGEYEPSTGVNDNVKGLLGMDLESVRENTRSYTTAAPEESLGDEWMEWVQNERVKRVAWAIFEFDCSLCTLTNHPTLMGLHELPTRFPCTESLWEAESAEAWAKLRDTLTPDDILGVPFTTAMGAVMAEMDISSPPIPPILGFWSRRICAEFIAQLLWNLRQLETLGSADFMGMPSLSTMKNDNNTKLLRGLDKLLASMENPASKTDQINFNMSGIIWHYSYLYTTTHVVDDVLYIMRNTVSRRVTEGNPDEGVFRARRRMREFLLADEREVRSLAWHAGQVIAISKDYLSNGSCEIMRTFVSYSFLIIIAQLCPNLARPRPLMPELLATTEATVRLDTPMHHKTERAREFFPVISRWLETGQPPASIGTSPNAVVQNTSRIICKDARAWLSRVKCFGMSESYTEVIDEYEKLQLL